MNKIGKIVRVAWHSPSCNGTVEKELVTAAIVADCSLSGTDVDYIVAKIDFPENCPSRNPYALVLDRVGLEFFEKKANIVLRLDKTFWINEDSICETDLGRVSGRQIDEALKKWSMLATHSFFSAVHQEALESDFVPGQSRVQYAGRVFDTGEMDNLVGSSLDFWLTAGRHTEKFESKLAEFLGVDYALFVNSGSSANLLAFAALTHPSLGDFAIRRGDEIITVAACFPTTVAPIFQFGAVPVFVDVDLETGNIDTTQLEAAISSKTKAVVLAHTLGNPFDIRRVKQFCQKYDLWLIEDNCDALGSEYLAESSWEKPPFLHSTASCPGLPRPCSITTRMTGSFGHIGTSSFYPAHHITTGEGGAVYTKDKRLYKILLSLRDWGRDCHCASGQDNACGKRFSQQHGSLPFGFDHKYVYSSFGYNLKATDLQAAVGCVQIEKVEDFIKKRRENYRTFSHGLAALDHYFQRMRAEAFSLPSWFGFMLTVRSVAPFTRNEIVGFLEKQNIQTRMLFAGNIVRHPCMEHLLHGKDYRIAEPGLPNTDVLMENAFWFGVYPNMKDEAIQFVIDSIAEFVESNEN